MTDRAPVVVVVGAASRDITDDDPRGWRLGGGASYSALALARLGIRTRALIGVDGLAATADELGVLERGGRRARRPAAGARARVRQRRDAGRARPASRREVSDPIEVTTIPRGWLGADGWMLAPVAAELRDAWSTIPADASLVGLGWQGLLRVLRAGGPVERVQPGPSPLVRRADVVGVGTRRRRARDAAQGARRVRRPGRHDAVHRWRRAAGTRTRWADGLSRTRDRLGRDPDPARSWTRSAPATRSSRACSPRGSSRRCSATARATTSTCGSARPPRRSCLRGPGPRCRARSRRRPASACDAVP